MKKTITGAFLGLITLACCFLIFDTHTSASVLNFAQSQNYSETSEEIEGELEIIAECEETDGRILYFVNTASGRISLKLAKSPDTQLTTGSHIRVKGIRIGDSFLASDEIELTDSNLQDITTTGERKVLAILVNFQDNPMQPYTPDRAREVIFNTTSNYFRESSYGQTWLTGDVYGWYTIPVNSTVCDTLGISTYALQAAVNAGANLDLYNQYVFVFPQTSACPWSGGSTIGGNPAKAWINTDWLALGTMGHELSHGLGLYHSHSQDCGATTIGSNCTVSDYGDSFDILGSMMSVHTNLYQKEQLGWVQPQLVTTSGTYHIDPYETLGGTKGLKILKSVDPTTGERTYYYVEKRTPFGFDVLLTNYLNPMTGVVIHTASDTSQNKSYLLDMTPATASWWDPALTVGQTFSDPDAGLTITTLSADATGALVQVSIASQLCVRSNPTLTFSPGQSPAVPSGSSVSFNLTVTNNDTGGCGASTFNLQASVPANWVGAFGSSAPVIDQGASATTSVQITSPIGAAPGIYPIVLNATNNSSPANTASATLQVEIAPPACARSNPTLIVSPAQSPGVPSGAIVSFNLTVRNNDTGGCGPSVFNLQAPVWANWTAVFDSPTLLIDQGSSATTTLRVTSPVGAAIGFYAIALTAVNTSSPANTASTTVQIEIAPSPCVRSNPTLNVSPAQGPSVPPGTTVIFNLTVRNNDTGGCGASAFNLQAHVPANWVAVFDSATPLIGQGESATTALQITSPVGTLGGSYTVNLTAINIAAPTSGSSANINYSVMSELAVTAAPTQTSYTRSQTATVNTTVRAGTSVVAGATVTFTMTKSNGTLITASRTTGSNGVATFSYTLSRKKDPTGPYQVRAQAASSGMSGTGNTGFAVR